MTATTKTVKRNVGAEVRALMNEMKDQPMSAVVAAIVANVKTAKDLPFTVGAARSWYSTYVRTGRAPGKVERETRAKAPKAPKEPKAKAPKAPKAKAKAAPKAPADRKDALKAAAKKAGVHRDTIAEALNGSDDPLNLGAPEMLLKDDLKSIL